MTKSLLVLAMASFFLPPPGAPTVVLVGGPSALWPQIVTEYARRYPSQPASWQIGAKGESASVDLVFAYYPTPGEITASKPLTTPRWLGFPTAFVADGWKQTIEQESSARAASYLDEGGVENGVRLLAYLYSRVQAGAATAEPAVKAAQAGIYHPGAPEIFPDFDSYRAWWQTTIEPARPRSEKPPRVVAVTFLTTWLRGQDMAVVDATIQKLEARGFLPLAVFGYPIETVTPLLQSQSVVQPEVVIALNASLSPARDAETYRAWGVPVLNALVTRESAEQWRASAKGLPGDRIAAQLSFPERSGLIAPTLAATTETAADGTKATMPFLPGIEALLDRAQRMLALRSKPNADKRVALIYYDNPAGKGNIGASYLQVFPSLRNILAAMAGDGYRIPQPLPDEMMLRHLLEANGRNVELWAEGETQRMAGVSGTASGMVQWPVAAYRRYYDELPVEFRTAVEATWGSPEKGRLMTADCAQGRCLLLPIQQQGNVLMAPQPLRTTFEQASDPTHASVTPPPHQYIAFYLWLQHEWKADVLVHVGRHGTLEWLPGKQTALAPEDAPSILIGDLPNLNIYVMDGGGEAIQAKRRGIRRA